MSILSKDAIENEVLVHLSQYIKGPQPGTAQWIGIVQLVFHRLKTGSQWR